MNLITYSKLKTCIDFQTELLIDIKHIIVPEKPIKKIVQQSIDPKGAIAWSFCNTCNSETPCIAFYYYLQFKLVEKTYVKQGCSSFYLAFNFQTI